MDFGWTPSQRAVHDRMRALGAEAGAAAPDDRMRVLARGGALGLPIARDLGGEGLDLVTTALAYEGLGATLRDGGVLLAAGAHLFGVALLLARVGTPAQRARVAAAHGERRVHGDGRRDRGRRRLGRRVGAGQGRPHGRRLPAHRRQAVRDLGRPGRRVPRDRARRRRPRRRGPGARPHRAARPPRRGQGRRAHPPRRAARDRGPRGARLAPSRSPAARSATTRSSAAPAPASPSSRSR